MQLRNLIPQEEKNGNPSREFPLNLLIDLFLSILLKNLLSPQSKKISKLKNYKENRFYNLLIRNKCGRTPEERKITFEEGKSLVESRGMEFFEISTQYNINIPEALMYSIKELLKTLMNKAPKGVIENKNKNNKFKNNNFSYYFIFDKKISKTCN